MKLLRNFCVLKLEVCNDDLELQNSVCMKLMEVVSAKANNLNFGT